MSTNDNVKIGILGLGRSGYGIHINALKTMTDRFQIIGVYDPLQQRAQEVADELSIKNYSSESDLLSDQQIELVIVASPNKFHAEQAKRALKAKKHVLCEKPFGLYEADGRKLIEIAKENERLIQPFQQRRYEPDFLEVKRVCDSGLLGDIHFVRICWHGFKRRWDWQTARSCAGGSLNNNGPHPLDHALILLGDNNPDVWAETRCVLCSGDGEDHVRIVLSKEGKPTIEIELSDIYAYQQERWFVCGSSGGLRGDANKLEWKWVDWSTMPVRPLDLQSTPDRSYNSEKLEWNFDKWEAEGVADTGGGSAPAAQPVVDLYHGLFRSIREGVPQEITPESVCRRVAVLEKIRKCAGIPASM